MDDSLLSNANLKGFKDEINEISKYVGSPSNEAKELDKHIDKFIYNITGEDSTLKYILIETLQLCYKDKIKLNEITVSGLLFLIYKRKDKIKNYYQNQKLKNIDSDETRDFKRILSLNKEDFNKLIDLFAKLGSLVDKVYGDNEEIKKLKQDLKDCDVHIKLDDNSYLFSSNSNEENLLDKNKKSKYIIFIVILICIFLAFIFLLPKTEEQEPKQEQEQKQEQESKEKNNNYISLKTLISNLNLKNNF